MTDEGRQDTEKWIEDKGARYPYAYVDASPLMSALRVSGYPSAGLIDASGKIVWSGKPAELSDRIIERHLTGTLSKPIYEWPKGASSIAKAFQRGDLGKALEKANEYALDSGEMAAEILADLEASRDARLEQFFSFADEGNFQGALDVAERLSGALEGHERLEEFQEKVAFLDSDGDVKKVLKGQKALAKLMSGDEPSSEKDCDKILSSLRKLQKTHSEGYLGNQIDGLITRFTALKARFSR